MARPSKCVSPDTLGGRIRAARQNLHLSLAEVAGNRYSTSLISQIERNRVDPSTESLHFLAQQLKLSFDDLFSLARQHRESEAEAQRYRQSEDIRAEASVLLDNGKPQEALSLLADLNIARVPSSLRWRMAIMRGQCYFELRQFIAAQHDFLYAVTVQPDSISSEQRHEVITLYLHLAAASRELGQLEDAFKQYHKALGMMNSNTPLHYIAEAHWGLALVIFEQDSTTIHNTSEEHYAHSNMHMALDHTRSAIALYYAIGEKLRAALLTCEIGLIEQALGHIDQARSSLEGVLKTWQPVFEQRTFSEASQAPHDLRPLRESANVVSAAACYLAGLELQTKNLPQALIHVHLAQQAAQHSYILRRAEALMMLGQILETQKVEDTEAENAFRAAIAELSSTDRLAAKIRAHDLLGRHLLKKGKLQEGEDVLNYTRKLARIPLTFTSATVTVEEASAAESTYRIEEPI